MKLKCTIGLLVLAGLAGGCANTREPIAVIPVQVTAEASRRITAPIAFRHDKGFRDAVHTIEPYRNQLYLPLKVGEASDVALRSAYRRVFSSIEEAPAEAASGSFARSKAIPVIEAKAVGASYIDTSGRGWGPFYYRVQYEFRFVDGNGTPIGEWRVNGFAHYDPSTEQTPRGEFEKFAVAPRRAIEDAANNAVRAFERVPEVLRLGRGLRELGSNAPPEQLVVRNAITDGKPGIEAAYPGAFSIALRRVPVPQAPPDAQNDPKAEAPLIALQLVVRNDSKRKIVLDPHDVAWTPPGSAQRSTLTVPAVAAVLSGQFPGVPGAMPMSPGVGMLPGLLGALAAVSSASEQKRQNAAWRTVIEKDSLTDSVLAPGDTRTGTVYFGRLPGENQGELVIRLIDLDDALRYTVRFPMPAS